MPFNDQRHTDAEYRAAEQAEVAAEQQMASPTYPVRVEANLRSSDYAETGESARYLPASVVR